MKSLQYIAVSLLGMWSCFFACALERPQTSPHCYKQVTGEGDNRDVTLLTLTQEGDAVTGNYYWLPAFKDRRLGSFEGKKVESGYQVDYIYQQEGSQGQSTLVLLLEPDQIVIQGGEPALGLAQTLPEVDCKGLSTPSP